MTLQATITPVTPDDGVRGGWRLHVVCCICGAEDTFRGFVMSLAADAAIEAGWQLDREQMYRAASSRSDICPRHKHTHGLRQGQVVEACGECGLIACECCERCGPWCVCDLSEDEGGKLVLKDDPLRDVEERKP